MRFNSLTRWDALKLIAVALMFVDHAGHFYFKDEEWLRGIGRACAPIFLFLAGFAPRTRFSFLLLAWAAALSLFEWLWMGKIGTLNMLWSILLLKELLAWVESRAPGKLRLHEWVIGSLVMLIPTLPLIQYGSFVVLFGLCGYVFRTREHYAPATPARFLLFSVALYGALVAVLSEFQLLTVMVMIPSLIAMALALLWFVRAPKSSLPCPAILASPLNLTARHTAAIYALHLMVLIAVTGVRT